MSVALFTRAWIEISPVSVSITISVGRPLHEGVDWNRQSAKHWPWQERRPLHEGVDWNAHIKWYSACWRVALFTRAWIEISHRRRLILQSSVALFTRAWIEIRLPKNDKKGRSRPLHEGVDWNCAARMVKALEYGRPLHEGVDWNF